MPLMVHSRGIHEPQIKRECALECRHGILPRDPPHPTQVTPNSFTQQPPYIAFCAEDFWSAAS